MIRIAVVDDDIYLCSNLEKIILAYNKISTYDFDVEVLFSGSDLLNFYKYEKYVDLILLDIEMEGFNGVEVGKFIREKRNDNITQIVYMTACDGYDRQLFQVRPMAFLEKPLKDKDIISVIEKYIELYGKMEQTFSFTYNRNQMKLPFKDIIYFKSEDKRIIVCSKDEKVCFYGKMNDILEALTVDFIIIHKSYVVNRLYIERYTYDTIKMINGEELPISQSYRKEVRKFLSFKSSSGKEFFDV